jgi:hypothetical protein
MQIANFRLFLGSYAYAQYMLLLLLLSAIRGAGCIVESVTTVRQAEDSAAAAGAVCCIATQGTYIKGLMIQQSVGTPLLDSVSMPETAPGVTECISTSKEQALLYR